MVAAQRQYLISDTVKNRDGIYYRPDIDALRALAVIIVVGFHVFPDFFPGGFIGVDIFFVISGFLISSIVTRELANKKFSFYRFYSRRIKRIFPAIILVIAVSAIAGGILLHGSERVWLGKHILGSVSFLANFVYWHEAGYFDISAESKPFLHFWSLAVEWQFYTLWPLVLFGAWQRLSLRGLSVSVLTISFIYSIYILQIDTTAAFYSTFARLWELLIGGLIALCVCERSEADILRYKNILSIVGLLILFFGLFFIDKSSPFPGWYVLIPTFGAICLILAGPSSTANHILTNKITVGIGLISYPLYLWHWPILAFYKIAFSRNPSHEAGIIIVIISLVLSYLTVKFVERPLRRSELPGIVSGLTLAMFGLGIIGLVFYAEAGSFETPSNSIKGMQLLNPS